MSPTKPVVISVNCDPVHRFSKSPRAFIRLRRDYGIEGDAHAGLTVQHRYLARRSPTLPNLRQVHLLQAELFDELAEDGIALRPGDLGENITTRGIDLLALPCDTRLCLGASAVVALTGLRTPCSLIDKFHKGLKKRMLVSNPSKPQFRAGVMAVVIESGEVVPQDTVAIDLPAKPWRALPALP